MIYDLPYLYISDSHFGHANIIKFSDRPFGSPYHMNQVMWDHLTEAATRGRIVHAGDLCLNSKHLPDATLPNRERHQLVMGNHDPDNLQDVIKYRRWFGQIHGARETWTMHKVVLQDWLDGSAVRVAVSHAPLRPSADWDYNVYGHFHNNLTRYPEQYGEDGRWGDYRWLRGSTRHFNACVEIVDYRPRTLAELRTLGIWR